MATPTPAGGGGYSGDGDPLGGDSGGGGPSQSSGFEGAAHVSAQGPSPPPSPPLGEVSLEPSTAVGLATAFEASPAQTSEQLDDDIWEIWFYFPGKDNVERFLCRTDITVKNLMFMIEEHGFGYENTLYYVRERGAGFAGMEAVDNMIKVQKMLALFKKDKVLHLSVLKDKAAIPCGLNMVQLQPEPLPEKVKLCVDMDGVAYISEDEGFFPIAIDMSDVLCIGTQQSRNMDKGKK
ncbi:unnamed protein product [Alopecurus aequalis]